MRKIVFAVPALLLAGVVVAQSDERRDAANPADPKAKVPPLEFRSAFDGYRPFADEQRRDWRKANEEVTKRAGGQGAKPQAGKPDPGHGGHK